MYEDDQGRIARELARYSDNYQAIFGRPGSPLIDRVAMILTGIGDVRTSKRAGEQASQSDPWYLETAKAEDPTAEDPKVLGLTVGNVGGVWIARDNLPEQDRLEVQQVNDRWLGAQHADFRRCSLNAVRGSVRASSSWPWNRRKPESSLKRCTWSTC